MVKPLFFSYDLGFFAKLFFHSLHNKTTSIFMETRERELSKKMINDLILTHFSIIWPNTTVLRKTKTRKLNQPGGNCKFFIRSIEFNTKISYWSCWLRNLPLNLSVRNVTSYLHSKSVVKSSESFWPLKISICWFHVILVSSFFRQSYQNTKNRLRDFHFHVFRFCILQG